ncbi:MULTISPECIES: ROK family protein [Clostridium]|uniref:ROK family protein n=1 Tax=Clostridium TaxID=1485 RepID=UPI00189825D5|nr:ROK family protein [Clostridium tertium]MDI9219012.1 ROK family protein [Clostridium tertium]
MKNYISIDIGGTAIKYGVIAEHGTILIKDNMDTEAHKGGPEILNKVFRIVEKYLEKYELVGICISTAGMVDIEKGEIFYSSPLIPRYAGTKFKKELEERFLIPCEVENDVNCAGLAERISGAAIDSKITLCLTIGTGIGGCILIDEKVFHGFSNSACEIGYMHMFSSDFQSLGATSILTKKVAERKKSSEEKWDGYNIFEEAKKGDEICITAIDEMVEVIAIGIANICYVINPEVVVLGGGIMAQDIYLKPKFDKAIKKYLLPSIAEKTRLEFAKHKNDAGMLGAFYNFKNRH